MGSEPLDIFERSPESKIVFLTQEIDPVVARAALSAGGHGYVVKCCAFGEGFAAIEAVMLGKGFVSPRLRDQGGRISIAQEGIAVEATGSPEEIT
jgi:DNA-binding NarL/FixJ family response regulator